MENNSKNNDKRFLNKDVIKEIISPKYNKEKTPFTLFGFHLPSTRKNTYENIQEEKRLQWLTKLQIESLLNKEIIEENIYTNISNQSDGYILEDILNEKIASINKNNIEKFIKEHNEFDFENIALLIKNDFIKRVNNIFNMDNSKKNILLHELYFNENKELKIKIKEKNIFYNVIDTTDPSNNRITVIKEKKLKIGNKFEFPDFAVYYNGLPFIVIEMKKTVVNGECGYKEAACDYYNKKSYHNFLACIGTNGNKTFISCSPDLLDPYIWENYPDLQKNVNYYDSEDKNGLYDILCELVTSSKNILFYFELCTMISETGDYLKNARIQQYFTAKQLYERMSSPNNTKGFKTHFQHHTRTGKSFTFKIIAKIAHKKLNHIYKKCIFFTHDIASVLPTVSKEFRYFDGKTLDGGVKLTKIENKKDYKKTLPKNNIFSLYITNMQKIAKENKVIDSSNGVLIFIDEVHTHQGSNSGTNKKGTMADFRKKQFPNATIISATASPLVKETVINGEISYRNITSELHGECINKVTPSDAMRLNLVTKLHFSKETFKSSDFNRMKDEIDKKNEEESKFIEENILKNIENRLIEGALEEYEDKNNIIKKVRIAYNNVIITKDNYLKITELNPFKENTIEYDQMRNLLLQLESAIDIAISKLKTGLKQKFRQELWVGTLKEKIDEIVIPEVLKQREDIGKIFTPKFFYVVNSRLNKNDLTNGEKMLNVIKDMIKEHINNNKYYDPLKYNVENNVYNGVRFGFDSSEEENIDNRFNGDLEGKIDITSLFEVEPLENKKIKNPCDVLILVRKKLMGYDNKNLTTVFLDKDIDEKNIKEMLQLATRGTTKRIGKNIGYIRDITLGERNIKTFKKAFAIYDEIDGVKEFLFNESDIIKTIYKLKTTRKDISDLFLSENISDKINEENIFNPSSILELSEYIKMSYWKWKEKSNNNDFINKYISLIEIIDKEFKELISPSFILEKKNEEILLNDIVSIFSINCNLLLDIKNKNTSIYKKRYTNEEIVSVLEKTFNSFGGVSAFIEKIKLKHKNSVPVENDKVHIIQKKHSISSVIGRLKSDLSKFDGELSGGISAELNNISKLIDTNEGDLDSQEKKIKEYENEIKKMKKEEQDIINERYKGNRPLYKIYSILKKYIRNEEILYSIAKNIDDNIVKQRNLIANDKGKMDLFTILINNVNFRDAGFINELKLKENYNSLYKDQSIDTYKTVLSPESGILAMEENKIRKEIENNISFDYIDENNLIFKILREYIE